MIAFCVLLFIVLIIGSRHAKKQAAKKRYVPQRNPAPVGTFKVQPPAVSEPKPDLVTLSLVERHFGTAWQKFLAGQPAQLNVSNPYIRHTIALCYEKLKSEEFLNLLQAFVSPKDRLDNYRLLHAGIYQLASSKRFVENDILNLLKVLPEQYRVLHIQDAVAPPIKMNDAKEKAPENPPPKSTTPVLQTGSEELVVPGAQADNDEETVEELEGIELPDAHPPRIEAEEPAPSAQGDEKSTILSILKSLPAEYSAQRVQIVGEKPIMPPEEDDVIDVDTEVKPASYEKNSFVVPVWAHQYVYSASELRQASQEQQAFYARYKADFLKGHHWDLQGNTNYGFILMFELLADYQRHKDLNLLEYQLRDLEISCPRTKPYAKSNLSQLMRAAGDFDGVQRLYDNFTWDWREKYVKALSLNKKQAALLKDVWLPSSQFIQIEFCTQELVRLYISASHYWQKNTDKSAEYEFLGDLIARKQNRYRNGSPNYKYTIEHCGPTIAAYILRYCESRLRAYLGHNRKVNVAGYLDHAEVQAALQERVIARIEPAMAEWLAQVPATDEAVETALNAISPTRWKTKLELSTANFQRLGSAGFRQAADQELRLNVRNPSLDVIFQEIVKFLAGQDKPVALQYQLRYSHYCFGIKKTDPKPMPKNLQKVLFKTEEQSARFEGLVSGLKGGQDLAELLLIAADFYLPIRKKIQLDPTLISQAEHRYEGTVEQLNEYLQEEELVELLAAPVVTANYAVTLTAIQSGLIELFTQHDYRLDAAGIDGYCQSAGAMRGALINSINENCYELLDDLLIEEDEGQYTINPNYYQQLLGS
jgi:hypothetical protein